MLYINQHVLKESKTMRKNVAMAWIVYKKAHDMATQYWIIDCLNVEKVMIHHRSNEKLESRINCWRKNFHWGQNP